MKQLFKTVLFCSAFAASFSAQATIWRLNNSNGNSLTPAINASFPVGTTLQQAHDNAGVQSGDTIHVEQSNTSYGAVVMTKKLYIIGPGYFLNMNPKTQVNTSYGATVGNITMDAATCAGSVITGLTINGTVYMGTSRLTVTRNYIYIGSYVHCIYVGAASGTTATDSNVISQNYIAPSNYSYAVVERGTGTGNLTNLIIANNYLGSNGYASINTGGRISGIIKNNVINDNLSVYNMYIVNNIMFGTGANTIYNSLIEYNLGKSANQFQAPGGANNTSNATNNLVNASQGFVGGTTSADGAWALLGTSPAKASGKSGEDMGMFGGTLPYVLSGIPTVPNIYALTIGTVAAGATSISVTVSTKSN